MTICLQKDSKKRDPKKGSKTGTRVMQVTGCGSLKTDKQIQHQTSDHQKDGPNTPWRAWRHGGGFYYIVVRSYYYDNILLL